MSQRNHSVDIVKGIGILLVIIGQCDLFAVFCSAIYSFHMPFLLYYPDISLLKSLELRC